MNNTKMGNSLLFQWENSQALKHHCGFCQRPLSHPAARSTCFGTHAEPCHRFHQAIPILSPDEEIKSASSDVLISTLSSDLASIPKSQHGRHLHWMKFTRHFVVDQSTYPFLKSLHGCFEFDSSSCAFEGNGVVDCPFHKPHCSCVDPMQDSCFVVVPGTPSYSCGPYNRLRGMKLWEQYQKDSRTKGYVMLIDADLIDYLLAEPSIRKHNRAIGVMPQRLAAEYANVLDGHPDGSLMGQERQFENRLSNSQHNLHQPSHKLLQDLQRTKFERRGATFMCYCHDYLPEERDPVKEVICSHRDCDVTYFHRDCLGKLGVEKVSRWFCTTCAKKMKFLAYKTLHGLGFKDVPVLTASIGGVIDGDTLQKVLGMPDETVVRLGDVLPNIASRFKDVKFTSIPMGVSVEAELK